MSNGRMKGSVAEREVARLLQPWWAQIEPEVTFVRTPLSGGWGTGKTREAFQASGDLMTTSRTFPFSVEVKRREKWTQTPWFNGQPSVVWQWWIQAITQSVEMKKSPMLWLRHNREPWRVCLPEELGTKLEEVGIAPLWKWNRERLTGVHFGNVVPMVFLADCFLKAPPSMFLPGAVIIPPQTGLRSSFTGRSRGAFRKARPRIEVQNEETE